MFNSMFNRDINFKSSIWDLLNYRQYLKFEISRCSKYLDVPWYSFYLMYLI